MAKFSQTKDSKRVREPKLIAHNLSALLKKNNLSANQLAHSLGLPLMTIRRLLSGATEDPRISTLQCIAQYFNVSLDFFVGNLTEGILASPKQVKSYLVPQFTWDNLSQLYVDNFSLKHCKQWQSLSLTQNTILSKRAFALESRPSMYPRFPKGTIFIIDPSVEPEDSDNVLIRFKDSNEFTLRELIIDPPDWRLFPLINDSNPIILNKAEHEICGVCMLTLLYNPKLDKN